VLEPIVRTLADGDVTVTPNSTPGNAVDGEVRGQFLIARNVRLDSKADNSIVASTSATTLADHSPSSDTVLAIGDPPDCLGERVPPSHATPSSVPLR
jgi:hypothetical protein